MVFSLASAGGPTFEVTDGIVAIDAGHFIRIGTGPVVNNQAASAHSFQSGTWVEVMVTGKIIVKGIPVINSRRRTKKVCDIHVNKMISFFQELKVCLRFMAKETGPPYPGKVAGWIFGGYDNAAASIIGEVVTFITIPNGFLAGNTAIIKPMGKVRDICLIDLTGGRVIAYRNAGPGNCEDE